MLGSPGDIVIAVMGVTGAGKTTFVNYLADQELQIGHGLEPCTQDVHVVPCTLPDGKRIYLVDTPGFDDTYRSDTEILREVANWLNTAYKMEIKLTGIIYLHRILDVRVGGAGVKNLKMFKKLCGDDGLASVVFATTMWSFIPDEETGKRREDQLKSGAIFWKHMIQQGSEVFRQDKGRASAQEIVNYLIEKRRPVTLDIQREMVDQNMQLNETGAGAEIVSAVDQAKRYYEQKLEETRVKLEAAIARKDDDQKEELEEYKKEMERKMAKDQEDIRRLQANSEQLHEETMRKHKEEMLQLTQIIQEKDKQLQEYQHQTDQLKIQSEHELEMEKIRAQMKLKELRYKTATQCNVM
ncbi:P-loop containing nucleoside triphosphate hydrolase protein [Clohesyomyces aquaticus]|uniref:p-loop containing nucleoside triphosphate hydrolase protein n=1 Tax=Clohesyomyces aquaticus TaxID=1231657 RepID=A0A1Y1YH22_9PLEO|nr:P-loop containing nucleoside triphosphate hydrolase protein [Clohesyomyces aquaticus]